MQGNQVSVDGECTVTLGHVTVAGFGDTLKQRQYRREESHVVKSRWGWGFTGLLQG